MRTTFALALALACTLLSAPDAQAIELRTTPALRFSGGAILVTFRGPRPMPAGTTQLQFTGSASLGSPALYTASRPPQSAVLLFGVPTSVNVLTIEYLSGSTVVGLFEGIVRPSPTSLSVVVNPPWVTQPPCHTPPSDDEGLFGADLEGFAAAMDTPQALSPRALIVPWKPLVSPPPPPSVTLDNLPPVGMQGTLKSLGSPGSCISWSFAYGLGSYTAARRTDGSVRWSPRLPVNQVSTPFLYALVHSEENPPKFCPSGSSSGYLEQLVMAGAPSMRNRPYAPDCCYINSINVDQTFPLEDRFRIGSYAQIALPGPPDGPVVPATLRLLKEHLASGRAVAFAGRVFTSFGTELPLVNGVYYAPFDPPFCEPTPTKPCGHGMLLVGYDDTLGDDSDPGAFLVQNSFGISWPPGGAYPAPPGMFYLAYSAFFKSQVNAQTAYPLDRTIPIARPLTAAPGGGPAAYVSLAYDWVDDLAGTSPLPAYLILYHRFSEPVTLVSVTVAEPAPSTAHVTQENGYPLASGYTYLMRNDGMSWLHGDYRVTIVARNAAEQTFTYTGTVPVVFTKPPTPALPRATMPGEVVGTTGAVFFVER